MKAIVRKRQQRKVMETSKPNLTFSVRGIAVDPAKIDRWMQTHNVSESHVFVPSPAACE
jgi:hypothetical protein